jgi:L-ribulose-5-phosphate 3-epimerase UlaE
MAIRAPFPAQNEICDLSRYFYGIELWRMVYPRVGTMPVEIVPQIANLIWWKQASSLEVVVGHFRIVGIKLNEA